MMHIEENSDYAETVLMPGDPQRAYDIAYRFLDNVYRVNNIRNCSGYTGFYKNKKISVQASGMGQASLAIYATELISYKNVKKIIRVGTCGAIKKDLNIGDVVIALSAGSDNTYINKFAPCCDYALLNKVSNTFINSNYKTHIGQMFSTDMFYNTDTFNHLMKVNGILALDMETSMLYYLSQKHNIQALSVNMVSDTIFGKKEELSPQERVNKTSKMVEVLLESL